MQQEDKERIHNISRLPFYRRMYYILVAMAVAAVVLLLLAVTGVFGTVLYVLHLVWIIAGALALAVFVGYLAYKYMIFKRYWKEKSATFRLDMDRNRSNAQRGPQ